MSRISKIYATVVYPDGTTQRLTWSRKSIGGLIEGVPALMRQDELNRGFKYENIGRVYKDREECRNCNKVHI